MCSYCPAWVCIRRPPKDSVKENTEKAPTSAPSNPGDPEQSESVRAVSEARGLSVYYLRHVLPKEVEKAGEIYGHTCTSGGGAFCGKAAMDCASGCGPPTPHDINKPVLQERSKGLKCPRDGEVGCAFVDYVAQETPEHVGKATRMLSYTWGYSIEQIGTALEAYCKEEGLDPKTVYVWICFACINQHRVTGNKPCIHVRRLKSTHATPRAVRLQTEHVACRYSSWANRSAKVEA